MNGKKQKDFRPLVSVGLPTWNRAHLLPKALDSLLNQTYQNIEYIISDNASTDGTEKLLRDYALRDPRIHYIRQPVNIDGIRNRDIVLAPARGKYFMWVSDDDWWDLHFVETLVDVLERHPDYGVAMSHFYERYIHAGKDEGNTVLRRHNFTNLSHQELYWLYLRGRKTIIFFFGLYRTELLKKIFKRGTPVSFQGTHIILAEVALTTRSYSVPLTLHLRLQDMRSHDERHPGHPNTVAEQRPLAINYYMFLMLWRLCTSSAIPLKRKFLIFGPWLRRAWKYKRKMFNEWRRVFLEPLEKLYQRI